jgi:hypothetical protein
MLQYFFHFLVITFLLLLANLTGRKNQENQEILQIILNFTNENFQVFFVPIYVTD